MISNNNILLAWFLILALSFNYACKQKIVSPRGEYKGKPPLEFTNFSHLPGDNYNFSKSYNGRYQQRLDERSIQLFDSLDITGITASVAFRDSGIWRLDTGVADLQTGTKVDNNTVFHWASVGKLVTSTIIHQLIEEGKLNKHSKLSYWYPEFPEADMIRIHQLLNHTSGIYSFNSDSVLRKKLDYTSPEEQIEIARINGNLFYPGEYWSYSNTNYTFLGLIIESITGKPFHAVVQERIVNPLNLKKFRALSPREQPENLAVPRIDEYTALPDYSVPFSAGNIVSDSREMIQFLHAMLSGKLLKVTTIEEMLTNPFGMFGDNVQYYGDGIMVYSFEPDRSDHIWIGHSGGFENYKALVAYSYESEAFAAVSINQDVSAASFVYQLFATFELDE